MTVLKPQGKTAEKKRQILLIALQCFTDHGVEGTTIEMIRQASGMSVGSLYHHFGNKDKIAAAVFIQGMREFGERLIQYLDEVDVTVPVPEGVIVEEGIKAIVRANIDWISDHPDWAKFVFHHRRSVSSGDAKPKMDSDMALFYQYLIKWFMPYAQQGILRPAPLPLLASLIIGPCHDYARHWLGGRYKVPLSKYRDQFAEAAWLAVKAD